MHFLCDITQLQIIRYTYRSYIIIDVIVCYVL